MTSSSYIRKNCICLEFQLLSYYHNTPEKSPECYSQFSSNCWPLPLGDGSGGITMGKFLQRCTESFNPMSIQFFTFYSQQHWGFCVYLCSPHATSSQGERRTAAILHSYNILSQKCVFLLPSPVNLHPKRRRGELKWTRLVTAVSGF